MINVHKQFVHLLVVPDTEEEWVFIAKYISPKPAVRLALRSELGEFHIIAPWCVIGDFKAVLNSDER